MTDWLGRTVASAVSFVRRHEVFSYRDEALQDWMLPGGVPSVQGVLLARLRVSLDRARSSNACCARLLASSNFDPMSLSTLQDMGALPVTTKDDIRRSRLDFRTCESRVRWRVEASTGGSTGQPLSFSMSRDDYLRSIGVQLAGWHLAGYVLGDRVGIFGGASVARLDSVPWRPSCADLVLNRRQFSAVVMDDSRIALYWSYLARWRPAYIRGYPFALAELCRRRPGGGADRYRPRAVLTTSERLTESDRRVIENTFEVPVFDGWGLNDGGAAAYECREHVGMHVDTTRAYVETVDDAGRPVWGVPGRIVVTSLTNRAFPFVRYDTGDVGVLTWRDCKCGRSGLMLEKILGRDDERLNLGGVRTEAYAGNWLTDIDRVRRWRVVQDGPLHITATFDVESGFDKRASEEAVTRSFVSRCPAVSITFVYAPLPLLADGTKWRSVIVLDSARRESPEDSAWRSSGPSLYVRRGPDRGDLVRDHFMEAISHVGTLLTRGQVLAYRDQALRGWKLPGGVDAVRSALLDSLRSALERARASNDYCRKLLASVGFDPLALTELEGLGAVPITTKDDIRRHYTDFLASSSVNLHTVEMTTGGSTGQPLRFSMSRDDYLRSIGVQLAGWHLAGYVLGDRIAVFAGASIAERNVAPWRISLSDLVLNRRQFSAADLDDDRIARYWEYIERWQPSYIRGYPSAIAELCRHRPTARREQYRPHAVLTTSEMLTPSDRHVIEETLGAPVFDGWGLNDGGAMAYECAGHSGMHVDTTRAYVETVDDAGRPVWGVPGRIVVTSLTNRAFPFVRYDTGDAGVLEWRTCRCGRTGLMLTQLLGRSNDTLRLGRARISPSSTTILFGRFEHLKRYHIVQDAPLHVTVTFDAEEGFDRKASEEAVMLSFRSRCPEASIAFVYQPLPLPTDGSKWQSVEVLDSARSRAGTTGPAGSTSAK